MSALPGYHRHPRTVTADGCGDAEPWVKTVKYGVGTGQDGTRSATQQGAGCQVTAGPRAEGDVKARLLEHGQVRYRQRRVVVLDEDPRTVPGSAG